VCVEQDYHSPVRMNLAKNWMWVSCVFIALEINITYRNVCILYKKNIYIYCIYSTYTVQVCMFTRGIG